MTVSILRLKLNANINTVWSKVTCLTDQGWRSDVARIEIDANGNSFTEYAIGGLATFFTITAFEPKTLYAFDIENANMKGRWSGKFTADADTTEIIFTEEIEVKKPVIKLFIKNYLKKRQKHYAEDLKKALQNS